MDMPPKEKWSIAAQSYWADEGVPFWPQPEFYEWKLSIKKTQKSARVLLFILYVTKLVAYQLKNKCKNECMLFSNFRENRKRSVSYKAPCDTRQGITINFQPQRRCNCVCVIYKLDIFRSRRAFQHTRDKHSVGKWIYCPNIWGPISMAKSPRERK